MVQTKRSFQLLVVPFNSPSKFASRINCSEEVSEGIVDSQNLAVYHRLLAIQQSTIRHPEARDGFHPDEPDELAKRKIAKSSSLGSFSPVHVFPKVLCAFNAKSKTAAVFEWNCAEFSMEAGQSATFLAGVFYPRAMLLSRQRFQRHRDLTSRQPIAEAVMLPYPASANTGAGGNPSHVCCRSYPAQSATWFGTEPF
jgi:hypothetical protein